ncbi:MAG: hypothetical protein GX442_14375 [Candidatus Riflebacteria bacterium]|nr:hypothetical protein [Candidatus Riflebacteria bacterium]
MFLKGLNAMQQKLFLGVAQQLAEADDKISVQERDMLNALSEEMGQQELIPNPDDDVLEAFFPDKASRAAVMLEIIGLATCDGIVPAENRLIKRLQRVFAIPAADLAAYQSWVKRFFAIRAEAVAFFVDRPAQGKAKAIAPVKPKTKAKAKAPVKAKAKTPVKATAKGKAPARAKAQARPKARKPAKPAPRAKGKTAKKAPANNGKGRK